MSTSKKIKLVDAKEAAERLGVGKNYVYELIKREELFSAIEGRAIFTEEEIRRAIKARTRAAKKRAMGPPIKLPQEV